MLLVRRTRALTVSNAGDRSIFEDEPVVGAVVGGTSKTSFVPGLASGGETEHEGVDVPLLVDVSVSHGQETAIRVSLQVMNHLEQG
jgi:hypothetical protein